MYEVTIENGRNGGGPENGLIGRNVWRIGCFVGRKPLEIGGSVGAWLNFGCFGGFLDWLAWLFRFGLVFDDSLQHLLNKLIPLPH